MGVIIRQSVKASIVTYLGVAIGAFNFLWFFPYYLDAEQIGEIRVVQDVAYLIAFFCQFGIATIADKYFFRFKSNEHKDHGYLGFLLLWSVIGFIIFVALYFLLKEPWLKIFEKNAAVINTFYYLLPVLAFFMMIQNVLEAYSRLQFRIVIPSIAREVVLRLLTMACVLVFTWQLVSFHDSVNLLVVVYGIVVLMLIGNLLYLKAFHIKINFEKFNRGFVKEILKYGFPLLIGAAAAIIIARVDSLMISTMMKDGVRNAGIYSIAFFIGTIIEVPKRTITQMSTPLINLAWTENNLPKLAELYKKTAINQMLVGGLLFLGVWCNVDELLSLIPNSQVYVEGKYVILFIGLGKWIGMSFGVNSEIIVYSNKYMIAVYSVVVLAVSLIGTNLIFIPLYGLEGAAFATALSILVYNILKYVIIWRQYKMQPFDLSFLKASLLFALVLFAGFFIDWQVKESDFWSTALLIAVRSLVITVLFVAGVWFLKISEDFNHTLLNLRGILKSFYGGKNKSV